MGLDDALRDKEPEPDAVMAAAGPTPEAIEDAVDVLASNADTFVAHLKAHLFAGALGAYVDGSRWRELQRIADQVGEHLVNARRITAHREVLRRWLDFELE